MIRMLAFLIVFAGQLAAESAMTADEFENYTQGKTLYFGNLDEAPYGIEQYKPNRRVIWSYRDGECRNGYWYEDPAGICFLYEFDPEPQCWKFFETPNGLRAEYLNRPSTTTLYEAQDSDEPLICPGPDVGV